MKSGVVKALSKSQTHTMSKYNVDELTLIKGIGVEGDAHAGKNVKHRSRVAKNPNQPNLRQIHLIHTELHAELLEKGFNITEGMMGENVTTSGIDLLDLPKDSVLNIGQTAKVLVTGLRNPCYQLDGLQKGLMQAVLGKDKEGNLIRKAGVMGVVLEGGVIKLDDKIIVELPEPPYNNLEKV